MWRRRYLRYAYPFNILPNLKLSNSIHVSPEVSHIGAQQLMDIVQLPGLRH
jgi:hypothetical protein